MHISDVHRGQLRSWNETGSVFLILQQWGTASIWSVLEEGEIAWYDGSLIKRDSIIIEDISGCEVTHGK